MPKTHSNTPSRLFRLRNWMLSSAKSHPSPTVQVEQSDDGFKITSDLISNQNVEFENHKLSPTVNALPLRVLLVKEENLAPVYAGRMLISGRMADVCAELDRLAMREAAIH